MGQKKVKKLLTNSSEADILKKLSRIVALILLVVVSTVLALAAFVYFTFALVAWLTPLLGAVLPLCIVGGIFVLMLILGIVFRKPLFINPLVAHLSHILFYETPNYENDENAQTL